MEQEPVQHAAMGYDRTSIMFSPDGRLLQVEYAKKSVKQGSTTIGLVCKDGVLIVADKRVIDRFVVPKSVEKIFQVDEHIGASASGFLSDGRVLIERAQLVAQQHRVSYDEPIDVQSLVKDICNIKQFYTQMGGARPFGVNIIFVGVDEEPELFVTDITGTYFQYKAAVIGEGETEVKSILNKEYRENILVEDGIKLAVKALKKVLGKDFDFLRIDGAYINTTDKKFRRISGAQIKKLAK